MAVQVGPYQLKDPERLFFTVIALAILIALLVRCSRGGNPIKRIISEDPEITTFSADEEVEKGVVKYVGPTSVDGLPSQLSVYMSTMLMTNLSNVNNGLAQQLSTLMTANSDFDPDEYRYIIAINPAHGGSDKGNTEGDLVEKEITLDVARMMVDYLNLNNNGFYFYLTRGSDMTMTDAQRISLMQSYHTNLVVNIHVNASDIEAGGTLATYYDDSLTPRTTNALDFDAKNQEEEEEVDMTRTKRSQELAQKLMDAASEGFGMWSRWTEVEDSPLLKMEDVIAVNVYLGYMTYFFDYNLLVGEEGRQGAAQGMAQALLEYLEYVAPAKSPMERQIEQLNSGSGSGNN